VFFRVFFILLIFAVNQHSVLAQNQLSDSSFLAQAMRYRRMIYQNTLADKVRLYNGTDYKEILLRDYDRGQPYFISPEWRKGTIEYEGQRFENVDLLYDLVTDKVLTHQYYTLSKIDLIKEKIASFEIAGHMFIHVSAGDSLSGLLKAGIYDRLEHGDVTLFAQQRKELFEDLSSGRIVQEFRDKNSYFIIKGGQAFEIRRRKDLFTVLSDKKSLIKSELSENRIRFGKQKEKALIVAAKLYNSSK